MDNKMIETIYDSFINSDEYLKTPEIQDSMKRARDFSEYESGLLLQYLPKEDYDAMSDATSEWAAAEAETGFLVGFKYGAKLMAEIYNTEESE